MRWLKLILFISLVGHAHASPIVEKILQAHESSQNYHEWEMSLLNPKAILKKMVKENICEDLEKIEAEKLSIFYNYLVENPQLKCQKGLIDKLESYYFSFPVIDSSFRLKNNKQVTAKVVDREIDVVKERIFFGKNFESKQIALTFDDGPHKKLTHRVLDILKVHSIPATFFLIGRNAVRYPDIVKRIVAEGHSLGNHTHSHKKLSSVSRRAAYYEVEQGFVDILSVVPVMEPYFRFPYGDRRNETKDYLIKNQMGDFRWNIDSLDWKIRNKKKLISYTLEHVKKADRGILLFHDIQIQTVSALPGIITHLKKEGYSFVRLVNHQHLVRVEDK